MINIGDQVVARIVFDSEKEIEDYICSELEQYSVCPVTNEGCNFWIRQFDLGAYGKPDIIKVEFDPEGGVDIAVMEIKKETINTSTVLQVSRYMKGIQKLFSDCCEIRITGEVVAPSVDLESDFVFLLDQAIDINAYTIHYDLNEGFSSELIGDYYKPEPAFTSKSNEFYAKVIMEKNTRHAEFIKYINEFEDGKVIDISGKKDG